MKALSAKLPFLLGAMLLAGSLYAQTGAIEGDVKDENGKPFAKGDCKKQQGACVKIERTDIKGNYQTATDKKGHFFHAPVCLWVPTT
jgi:hypothetical protein